MRSTEDSCQRLRLSRIDVALIHGMDVLHQGVDCEPRLREAMEGACRAPADPRAQGLIGA